MSKQPPPAPTASAIPVGPCPTIIQISRTTRDWKFTQDHRTTRPPTSLSVLLTILYFFSSGTSPTDAIKRLKGAAHLHRVYDWYNLYRDIMSRALNESLVQLGGVGVTVVIDESKWGYQRKYNRRRLVKEGIWIFWHY